MSEPWGVVIVPSDASGLLSDGPCGARPPAVRWMPRMCGGRGCWVSPAASRGGGPGSVIALPLWWDGAIVPEGWDRARRIAARQGARSVYAGIDACTEATVAARLGWVLEAAGLGRVVVLSGPDGGAP